jgi:hypothetical protein
MDELGTCILSSQKNSETFERRKLNTTWVKALPLDGLAYGKAELQLPIVKTLFEETIVIQYPGKESTQSKRRKWKNSWDFRPKLVKLDVPDLAFKDIWESLYENLRITEYDTEETRSHKVSIGRLLGTLFYRMAFMLDHDLTEPTELICNRVPSDDRNRTRRITVKKFWRYKPPPRTLEWITKSNLKWASMSLEAFLHYNSILAWNEDVKYSEKDESWTPSKRTGRINTILTHVRVVGFIIDEVKFSDIVSGLAQQRGVSPATADEILRICTPFVHE